MTKPANDLPSPDSPVLLAQLVSARLCDDVASLLAHARADLELTGEAQQPPAAMNGVEALSRRLALLRACWGPGTRRLTARTIATLAEGLPGLHRLRLDLSALPRRTTLSPAMSRVVLNALLLAAESLPRGGVISIAEHNTEGSILVLLSGTHAAWPRELSRLLNRPDTARAALSQPRRLLPPLVVLIAAHAGIRISFHTPQHGAESAIPALLLSSS